MDTIQKLFPSLQAKHLLRWLAMIGAVALLTTLIIYLIDDGLPTIAFITLVIGVVGVGAWVIFAPDEVAAWLAGRQVYYGTGSVLLVVVIIGIAAVGYSLARSQNIIVDITESQDFTISQPSINVLNDLETRLSVSNANTGRDLSLGFVSFYSREELRERQATEFLLRQYETESQGLLSVEFIDPDVEPLLARSFGYEIRLGSGDPLSGPSYLVVYENDQALRIEEIGVPNERNIQNAMLRILIDGQFKVYFVTGQLELDPTVESDIGISELYRALPAAGFLVDTLSLSEVEEIPADADTIVIAGAQFAFPQSHVDKIDAYIQRGGRMLIMADPPYVDSRSQGEAAFTNEFLLEESRLNQYLWNEFGIRVQENAVADPNSSARNEFILSGSGLRVNTLASSVMSDFPQVEMALILARSIEMVIEPEPDTNQGLYIRSILLSSTDAAFGERSLTVVDRGNLADFDPEVDDSGPLFLAVSARRASEAEQDSQPRVIVIGDSDWASNAFIAPEDGSLGLEGNIIMWSRFIEWLTGSSEYATVEVANRPDLLPLYATAEEQQRIQLITLVFMPGMILLVGATVWIIRRRS